MKHQRIDFESLFFLGLQAAQPLIKYLVSPRCLEARARHRDVGGPTWLYWRSTRGKKYMKNVQRWLTNKIQFLRSLDFRSSIWFFHQCLSKQKPMTPASGNLAKKHLFRRWFFFWVVQCGQSSLSFHPAVLSWSSRGTNHLCSLSNNMDVMNRD